MLQRNGKVVRQHAFLMALELEEGSDIAYIINRLGEGVQWIEGVGRADTEHLGELDVYPDTTEVLDTLPNEDDISIQNVKKEVMN